MLFRSCEFVRVISPDSQKYPFNNSTKTVALKQHMDTTAYTVEVDVLSTTGEVGRVVVSDKQLNGFKVSYTGSATSVTIKFFVKGGRF